jgi:hypothetical protein
MNSFNDNHQIASVWLSYHYIIWHVADQIQAHILLQHRPHAIKYWTLAEVNEIYRTSAIPQQYSSVMNKPMEAARLH